INSVENGAKSIEPQLVATTVFVLIYFGLWFFSKGKYLGDGDIRLAAVMGLLLTLSQLIVGVFVAYILGALIGIYLISKRNKKINSAIPMGPFLIFGIYFGLLFGSQVASWYTGIFRF
ncbi:MAG: prepilin peptidase, partial [Candidatus Saccharibacteria bacterium]